MMSEELMIVDGETTMLGELESPTTFMCSMKVESREDKARLFNLTNNPTHRLADCIGETIEAKDIFIEIVECESQANPGTKVKCPRIVIIASNGESYQCVSNGVFNSLKKIISMIGAPTWEEPVKIIPKQISKGNRTILAINLAV